MSSNDRPDRPPSTRHEVKSRLSLLARRGPNQTAWGHTAVGVAAAAGGIALMTGVITLIPQAHTIADISMLYLLVVFATAISFGSVPAVAASILAFFVIDWYFVSPHSLFTASDPAEYLALVMFTVTALATGHLTGLLREREEQATRRERETAALAAASWTIASQVERSRALAEVIHSLSQVLSPRRVAIFVETDDGELDLAAHSGEGNGDEWRTPAMLAEVQRTWSDDRARDRVAIGTLSTLAIGKDLQFLPLAVERRVLGVLCLQLTSGTTVHPDEHRVIDSLANHAAVILERDRLMRAEADSRALHEADRLKTALLSMVSHDFRSPLASIKASVTGLLQVGGAWQPGAEKELLQAIDQEADRLNRLVENVLALSRLDADAWRPQCERTPLDEVVSATLDSFSEPENARIRLSMETVRTDVWIDPVQIVQVLHNLLENALKYSPADAAIELRVRDSPAQAIFEVLDRGCGLPPGEEQRIFERFYRAPGLQESSMPGLGLGLSLCRGLVEAHGGALSAENRPEGGTLFRIVLPQLELAEEVAGHNDGSKGSGH